MNEPAAVRVIVRGLVQGVMFRQFTVGHARGLGLEGYARNLPDGTVEVVAEGEREKIEGLLEFLRKGPGMARVESVDTAWETYSGEYGSFRIRY